MKSANLHLLTSALARFFWPFVAACSMPLVAAAGTFASTNIVVERMGNGSAALTSGATPVFIDEYLPSTANQETPVQSVSLPNVSIRPSANPFNLMDSGSASSDGQITRSFNGTLLQLPGYNGITGDASIVNSDGTAIPRVIGLINNLAGIDTSRSMDAYTNGNNFRSVVSVDGSAFWCAGATNSATGASSQGIIFYTNGTVASLANADARYLGIFGGQLFYSTQNAPIGIYALGQGLPTGGSPAATPVILPTGGTPAPVAFQFNPATNICYIADSRGSKGGVFKYSYTSGAWVSNYLFGTTLIPNGAFGLAVNWSATNPVLYITTAGGTNLISITDSNANATAKILASVDGSTKAFRGVALAPVTAATPPLLKNQTFTGGANPAFQFGFTNSSGLSFSVLASTNLALPLSFWSNLGTAVETPAGSGQFQFTDWQVTNKLQRFYSVRTP